MMRRALQPLWFLLALIFLVEAWLWDHLEPVVARVVALFPFKAFKAWLSARVARLSPYPTLLVFIAPLVILLVPLKFAEMWLLTQHYWIAAIALIVASKFIGVGVLAFIFDVTRDKLLKIGWFRRGYELMLDIRNRAHDIVAPVTARIKAALTAFRGDGSPRWLRLMQRIRQRAHSAR
jgi:hypothetical protein